MARREDGRWAQKNLLRVQEVSCRELLGCEPYRPGSGLAVPPYRQRQVGGRVIGPVPSTPLSIVFNFTLINIILSRIIVNTFRMVSVSVLRRPRPHEATHAAG
jgi:hypothetical protein